MSNYKLLQCWRCKCNPYLQVYAVRLARIDRPCPCTIVCSARLRA